VSMVFTRDLLHYGLDKYHTPLWSLSLSKESLKLSTNIGSQNQRTHTARPHNYLLLLHQDILLVFSALLSLTLLIQWFQNWITWKLLEAQWIMLRQFTVKSGFLACGEDSEQELSWLVLWLAYNGGSMIHSKPWLVYKQLEALLQLKSEKI